MANSIYSCGCAGNGSPATDEGVSTCGCGNTCGCGGSCPCGSGSCPCNSGGENDLLTLIATVLLVVSLLWGRN